MRCHDSHLTLGVRGASNGEKTYQVSSWRSRLGASKNPFSVGRPVPRQLKSRRRSSQYLLVSTRRLQKHYRALDFRVLRIGRASVCIGQLLTITRPTRDEPNII